MGSSLGQALVTGAAQRLGREIALELARAGYDIALHYGRSEAEAEQTAAEIRQLGVSCVLGQADLSQVDGVKRLFEHFASHGPITCLVNNASVFEFDHAAEFSPTLFQQHMLVNLQAPLLLAQAMYHAMTEGDRGVVVNMLDQKLSNMNPDFLSYTLSKAGLQTATTAMSVSFAPRLRVVGVAPGLTMISHLQTQEQFENTHKISPIGRSSEPEDIARAVRFLVESPAITGTTLLVDGGQHLVPMERDFSMMNS